MSEEIEEIRQKIESGIHDCSKLIVYLQTDDETFEAGEDLDKAMEKLKYLPRLCDALDYATKEINIFAMQVEDTSEKGFALAEGIRNKIAQILKGE